MAWIFVDKEEESGKQQMRSNMRHMMRSGGYRSYGGSSANMRGDYSDGYRMGYRHGWDDREDDMDDEMEYRRRRDSRGRFI